MNRALAVLLLVAAFAAPAPASPVRLSWEGCGAAGLANRTFACNTNAGTFALVHSFVVPHDFAGFVGYESLIEIEVQYGVLPAWWEYVNAGYCRRTSLALSNDLDSSSLGTCVDFWTGRVSAGGLAAYRTMWTINPTSAPNRAQIFGVYAVPIDQPLSLAAGTEYFAYRVLLNAQKTTGADACFGCGYPARIWTSVGRVYDATSFEAITNPNAENAVWWQAPPVATRNVTWGRIKAQYR